MKIYIRFIPIFLISLSLLFSCEKEPPAQLELSSTTVLLSNSGAEATIEITANGNWTASVASTWCTISPSSGKGNGTVRIVANDNIGDEERSVTLNIVSRELKKYVKIVQDVSSLELDRNLFNLPKGGASATLAVTSNTSWEVFIPANAGWISANPIKGEGNANVVFTITGNQDVERDAVVEVKYGNRSKNLTIVQERGINREPLAPVLKSPAADATDITRLPAFRWSSAKDPDGDEVSYIFEYGKEPGTWISTVPTEDSIYYLPAYLDPGQKYYWRVTAVDKFDGASSTVAQSSFTTGTATSYFDGEYKVYQTHTKGSNPSVLVFMGDGYQAEDHVEGGLLDNHLDEGIEAFFSVEPYKSYREYFTVYKVGAYSRDSGVKQTDKNILKRSAFNSDFLGGSSMSTNTDLVFQYARVIPGIDEEALKNTLMVLVVNENRYAGTCWMWSDGKAVAIAPVSRSTSSGTHFSNIVNHEAGGHGFGRLADEYINSANTGKTLPEADKTSFLNFVNAGFYANVDVTGDQTSVKWKHFIGLPGYSRVGVYEGAIYYTFGAWRSETSSCMIHNEKYYNAPSREAIVKRILKTAGEPYSLNEFVTKDIEKSPSVQAAIQTKSVNPFTFVPLAPPVLVK